MTKLSLSIIVFLFFSNHSIAQQHKTFGYGIKAGLNYTVANETSNDFNFYAGAFLHLAISDEFKIQPEILYSKYNSISVLDKDVKVKYYNTGRILTIASGDEYKVSESTLQLPVMIQYHFSRKLYGEIGPQVIYLFDRKIDFTEESLFPPVGEIITTLDNEFDYGAAFGVGCNLNNFINISGRYSFSIIENSKIISLGLAFKR